MKSLPSFGIIVGLTVNTIAFITIMAFFFSGFLTESKLAIA